MSNTKPTPQFFAGGQGSLPPQDPSIMKVLPGVDFFSAQQAGNMIIDFARERAAQRDNVITFGLPTMDADALPIYPGQLGLIVGIKHNGKSALARHIARHNAAMLKTQQRLNDVILYVHCEENAVRARVWTMNTPMPMSQIVRGTADEDVLMAKVAATSSDQIYYLGKAGVRTGTFGARRGRAAVMVSKIAGFIEWAEEHGVNTRLIVVDYLQKMRSNTPARSEVEEVAQISDDLLDLTDGTDAAVIVACQANAKGIKTRKAEDRMPQIEDIWYSSRIAHNADIALGVTKPSQDKLQTDKCNGMEYQVERTHFKIEVLAWRECGAAGNQYLLDMGGGYTGRQFGDIQQLTQYDPAAAAAALAAARMQTATAPPPPPPQAGFVPPAAKRGSTAKLVVEEVSAPALPF